MYLLDGIHGELLGIAVGDDTRYATGYSGRAFRQIRRGMSSATVQQLLGKPSGQSWEYERNNQWMFTLIVDDSLIQHVSFGEQPDREKFPLRRGSELQTATQLFGEPSSIAWSYSESPRDQSYRVRVVVFRAEEVERVIHKYYWD